ncbi:MAG: hypothetical protein ACLQQ4_02635 [Bacteroidia bacterium]
MKNSISNYIELEQRIMQLRAEKTEHEELIKSTAKEILYSFDPVNIIKKKIHNIINDQEIQESALTALLAKGAGFIVKKISDRKKKKEKHFPSFIAEKISGYFTEHEGVLSSLSSLVQTLFARK